LVGHLNCGYLTYLDLAVAKGEVEKPFVWDPLLAVLAERGARHEVSYLEPLETSGLGVARIDGIGVETELLAQTLDAMRHYGVEGYAQFSYRQAKLPTSAF
jgi:uncharacterized protein